MRRLARHFFGGIVRRERDINGLAVTGAAACQLLLETGDHGAAAEFQRYIAGGVTAEGLAVDGTLEIDLQPIALGRWEMTGLDDEMSPGTVTRLIQSDEVAFRALAQAVTELGAETVPRAHDLSAL